MKHSSILILYIFLTTFLFISGISGFILNKANFILMLISLELMILAINLNFLFLSTFRWQNINGQIITLFILTVAAAEVSIGLAIMIAYYRISQIILIQSPSSLKG
jgi:NADH-quinone oxidoreductase subunit K